MLRIKNISEVIDKKVFTNDGDFFGQVEEVSLVDNRIEGWRIRVASNYAAQLGGARGVVIPHQFVKSIGDVFIITRGSLPAKDDVVDLPAPGDAGVASAEGEDLV